MSVAAAQHVEAISGLKSTVTKVTPLFVNSPGPLPLERAFQSSGGSFLIFVSGSVRASQVQLMQIGIFLDGEQVQTSQEWTNNPNSHTQSLTLRSCCSAPCVAFLLRCARSPWDG